MAGLLSGLSELGLGNLESMEIYEEKKDAAKQGAAAAPKVEEKDLIYDKTFTCPVCDSSFTSKVMKSGKAKLLGMDEDLRPRYEGIDAVKYDVELCPTCGYAAISRFFAHVTGGQAKLIKENISQKVRLQPFEGETYTYEDALQRYKLALVSTVVKRGRASEKAYVCLKSAWLLRGYAEYLRENGEEREADALKAQEDEYMLNAFNGFVEARQSETFPMCGMDEVTIDYLLAELAFYLKKFDVSSKMVASILTSPSVNNRIKDKARDLKERIVAQLKKK